MAKVKDFINFILTVRREMTKEEIKKKFALTEESWAYILKVLIDKDFITEVSQDNYITKDNALAIPGYTFETIKPLIESHFSGRDDNPADVGRVGWDTVKVIDKFMVYPGEDLKIYEIHFKGKIIKMEGKDIMDVDIFILKLFEVFGIMLPKYKNLNNDWAAIVSFWMQNYGEVVESHTENISANTEAIETVLSYINHAVPTDEYIVKEGFITYKNDMIYVPVRSIRKILKREEINISIRKLGYIMKDYLLSGSVPLRIENKCERFWKLNPKKFDIKLEDEIKIEKEPDEEDPSESKEDPSQTNLVSAGKPADLPAVVPQIVSVVNVVETPKAKEPKTGTLEDYGEDIYLD
jgi:hypothetical protein